MANLNNIVKYTNELLDISQFRDFCPNGLQVQGRQDIGHIVGGVTASQALINQAIEANADAILVHHGFFWKGEDPTVTGMKYNRLKALLDADIALLAYHLPLDAHPLYGNNVQLAKCLGLQVEGGFARNGSVDIALHGHLSTAISAAELKERLDTLLGRQSVHFAGNRSDIHTVGWCTGAAQGYLEEAAALGVDAYITGEVSEQTFHAAHELGVHFYAAGHHATERFGVQALGAHLADCFSLEFTFLDIDNPV